MPANHVPRPHMQQQVKAQIANASDRNFERWKPYLANPLYPAGWRAQWDAATSELQVRDGLVLPKEPTDAAHVALVRC